MIPAQCRAARALIDMHIVELSSAAVVPATAIFDLECGVAAPSESNLQALRKALEWAGVEFIDGDRPGVRLSKQPK